MSCCTASSSLPIPKMSTSQRQIRAASAVTSGSVVYDYCKGQRTKMDAPLHKYSFFVEVVCAPVEDYNITSPQYVYQVRKLDRISVELFDEFMSHCKCKWISYSLPYHRHSKCHGKKHMFKHIHIFITCTVSSLFGMCAEVWKIAKQLKQP